MYLTSSLSHWKVLGHWESICRLPPTVCVWVHSCVWMRVHTYMTYMCRSVILTIYLAWDGLCFAGLWAPGILFPSYHRSPETTGYATALCLCLGSGNLKSALHTFTVLRFEPETSLAAHLPCLNTWLSAGSTVWVGGRCCGALLEEAYLWGWA